MEAASERGLENRHVVPTAVYYYTGTMPGGGWRRWGGMIVDDGDDGFDLVVILRDREADTCNVVEVASVDEGAERVATFLRETVRYATPEQVEAGLREMDANHGWLLDRLARQ